MKRYAFINKLKTGTQLFQCLSWLSIDLYVEETIGDDMILIFVCIMCAGLVFFIDGYEVADRNLNTSTRAPINYFDQRGLRRKIVAMCIGGLIPLMVNTLFRFIYLIYHMF